MLTGPLPGEMAVPGHIHATYSEAAGTSRYYHVLTVNLTQPWVLKRAELYPAPAPGQAFAVRDWHHGTACIDGAKAVSSGCISLAKGGHCSLEQRGQ